MERPVVGCRAVKALPALLVLAATVSALAPAAASASDRSVYRAYVSRDSDFASLGSDVGRALRRWERSGHKRQAAVLKALRRGHELIRELTATVKAEPPSSENGTRGKKYALASLTFLDRFFTALGNSVRARTAGHAKAAKAYMEKAQSFDERSGRAEKRARKYFKAAGVPIKRDPASP
jgi:hypothetical protein